jgi:uncharacterized protein
MKVLSAGLLLLLSGCSSQPAMNYYQLPVGEHRAAAVAKPGKSLYFEPVQVASYLNGRGLVLQLSPVELVMARQHLWAEPLEQQLQRQLRDRVLALSSDYGPVLQAQSDTVRVAVQLDAFHGQPDGYALISGHFFVSTQRTAQPFSIRIPLADDGYPALVSALGLAVQQLSERIAGQLNAAASP